MLSARALNGTGLGARLPEAYLSNLILVCPPTLYIHNMGSIAAQISCLGPWTLHPALLPTKVSLGLVEDLSGRLEMGRNPSQCRKYDSDLAVSSLKWSSALFPGENQHDAGFGQDSSDENQSWSLAPSVTSEVSLPLDLQDDGKSLLALKSHVKKVEMVWLVSHPSDNTGGVGFYCLMPVLSMLRKRYSNPQLNAALLKLRAFCDHHGANWNWFFCVLYGQQWWERAEIWQVVVFSKSKTQLLGAFLLGCSSFMLQRGHVVFP